MSVHVQGVSQECQPETSSENKAKSDLLNSKKLKDAIMKVELAIKNKSKNSDKIVGANIFDCLPPSTNTSLIQGDDWAEQMEDQYSKDQIQIEEVKETTEIIENSKKCDFSTIKANDKIAQYMSKGVIDFTSLFQDCFFFNGL